MKDLLCGYFVNPWLRSQPYFATVVTTVYQMDGVIDSWTSKHLATRDWRSRCGIADDCARVAIDKYPDARHIKLVSDDVVLNYLCYARLNNNDTKAKHPHLKIGEMIDGGWVCLETERKLRMGLK